MKRRKEGTESLVYAYGCGDPLIGEDAIEIEAERMRTLWNRLVEIERAYDDRMMAAACRDDERLAVLMAEIEHLRGSRAPEELEAKRELWRHARERLAAWRKSHPERVQEAEKWRREQVALARRESGCYWGNYNEIISRYETARIELRKRGRRLRVVEDSMDEGMIAVQIQRTRSGLGAAPHELHNGALSQIQIAPVDPRAYDPSTPRGVRRRLCRTVMEMRADASGAMVRIPIWMHRPLPPDCRIKAARLKWDAPCGGRRRYTLCLTISRPKENRVHPRPDSLAVVSIDIGMQGRELRVARVAGHKTRKEITIDSRWLAQMRRVHELAKIINEGDESSRDVIRAKLERPGLWRRLLLRRREQYRLIAREIAMEHGSIIIETPALSEMAKAERGTEPSSHRHLASAHELIRELRHQAAKHGASIDVRVRRMSRYNRRNAR